MNENESGIVKSLGKSTNEKLFKRFYCIRWYQYDTNMCTSSKNLLEVSPSSDVISHRKQLIETKSSPLTHHTLFSPILGADANPSHEVALQLTDFIETIAKILIEFADFAY